MCIWSSSWPSGKRTTATPRRRASSPPSNWSPTSVDASPRDSKSSACRSPAALASCSTANWSAPVPNPFSSRPSPSTAGARPTSSTPASCACACPAGWTATATNSVLSASPPKPSSACARAAAAANSWPVRSAAWPIGGTARSEYCHVQLPTRWWGPRNWKSLATLDSWVLGVLEKLRQLILALEGQLRELEGQLKARVRGQVLPKGLGELTLVTVDSEICDWRRFSNRKQVGSYTGCCPSEHSSGGQRRLGSIDRMGNGRVRALLVEAVWRFLRWQPNWKAAQRMQVKLADSSSMRKKRPSSLWPANWPSTCGAGAPAGPP